MSRRCVSERHAAMCSSHSGEGGRSRPSSSSPSTILTSPTMPTSTLTFLLISAGSMSTWITCAPGRVALEVAGDPVVEAHAQGDEQIGVLDGLVDLGHAVHAHHAEAERMIFRDRAHAQQRERNRHLRVSANTRNSSVAPAICTPWPARIIGRRAAISSARPLPARACGGPAGTRARNRLAVVEVLLRVEGDGVWTSLGISTSTGPGRPVRAT